MAEFDQQSLCSEETGSIYDEERVRKLFQACDTNGDGFIDSEDLLTVCRELNLDYSLEELMQELGADENGKISYDEFLRRRLALKPEIEALRSSELPQSTPEYLPTSSDNSLEGASGSKERWEFDSGARDLSPEPNTLQRLVEAAGGSITTRNAASLLQLANKLHLAALTSLRSEISDLTYKLEAVTDERDQLLGKLRCNECCGGNESIIEQYEERLTELHSVIAELNRKMDRQCTLVIEEEAVSEADNSVEQTSQSEFEFPSPPEEMNFQESPNTPCVDEIADEIKVLRTTKNELEEQLNAKEEELKKARAIISPLKQKGGMEVELLTRKLERRKADNTVLQLSLQESKEHCERLTLLLGKYESNMTALKLALNSSEHALEIYRKLEALLESYISSPVKRNIKEVELREKLRILCAEKERVCGTVMDLESYVETVSTPPNLSCNPPRIDLETAVLIQEVMREREERGEVRGRLVMVEKEKETLEHKLKSMESKQQELLATIHRLQNSDNTEFDAEYLNREYRLREKLSRSLERQSELTSQLKNANSALLQSLEKHKRKSQAKLHRMETQMLDMVEHHAAQVRTLKQKMFQLEDLLGQTQDQNHASSV